MFIIFLLDCLAILAFILVMTILIKVTSVGDSYGQWENYEEGEK